MKQLLQERYEISANCDLSAIDPQSERILVVASDGLQCLGGQSAPAGTTSSGGQSAPGGSRPPLTAEQCMAPSVKDKRRKNRAGDKPVQDGSKHKHRIAGGKGKERRRHSALAAKFELPATPADASESSDKEPLAAEPAVPSRRRRTLRRIITDEQIEQQCGELFKPGEGEEQSQHDNLGDKAEQEEMRNIKAEDSPSGEDLRRSGGDRARGESPRDRRCSDKSRRDPTDLGLGGETPRADPANGGCSGESSRADPTDLGFAGDTPRAGDTGCSGESPRADPTGDTDEDHSPQDTWRCTIEEPPNFGRSSSEESSPHVAATSGSRSSRA